MHPILLKFGPLTIYSYGAMIALGFGLATFLMYMRAPRFGIDRERIINLAILILISGIVGARILYVILNASYYSSHIFEIFNISRGGLVWYGGFFSALLVLVLYIIKKGLDFWSVTDFIIPYVSLAQGFGRIGCFLNGCCYGIQAHSGYVFGVAFPNDAVLRHPSQIYSAIFLFFIAIVLVAWQARRHFEGEIFLGYCILYSLKRFFIEFLRGDNIKMLLNLTLSQLISLPVFVISALILIHKLKTWKKNLLKSK